MGVLGNAAWFNNLLSTQQVINLGPGEVLVDGPLQRISSNQQVSGSGTDLVTGTVFTVTDEVSGAVILDVAPTSVNAAVRNLRVRWPNLRHDEVPDLFKNAPAVRVGAGSTNALIENLHVGPAVWGVWIKGTNTTVRKLRGRPVYRGVILDGCVAAVIEDAKFDEVWFPAGCLMEGWQAANGVGLHAGTAALGSAGVKDFAGAGYGSEFRLGGTW